MASQVSAAPLLRLPSDAEVTVVEHGTFAGRARWDVDAVGDVADRDFVLGLAGIETGPHRARDFAVQGGDAVGATRELEAEHGHAERLGAVGWVDAAEGA